jgi:pimeloyl-ACP methyl ester carboxylesterase
MIVPAPASVPWLRHGRERRSVTWRRRSAAIAAAAGSQRVVEWWLRRGVIPPGVLAPVVGEPTHVVVDGPRHEVAGPVVVFANGLGGSWFDWDGVIPLLPADVTTVRLDRPGLGWTPGPSRVTDLARETDRLRAAVAAVGLTPPLVVVGWSYGGFVAQGLARRYPDAVAGMVLVDSSCVEPAHRTAPPPERRAARTTAVRSIARLAVEVGLGVPIGLFGRRFGMWLVTMSAGDPSPSRLRRAVYGSRRAVLAVVDELLSYDVIEADLVRLERTRPFPTIPVRILAGDGSRFPRRQPDHVWRALQRQLLELTSDTAVTYLPSASHAVMVDRPDTVAGAITDVVATARAR